MALKLKTIKTDYGVEYNDVYFKITLVSYNDEDKELSFAGACYINEEASRSGSIKPIAGLRISGNFPYSDKTGNWYEAVYNYIKEQSQLMKGKTIEDVLKENEEEYLKVLGTFDAPQNIKDPNYMNFVDAEDC